MGSDASRVCKFNRRPLWVIVTFWSLCRARRTLTRGPNPRGMGIGTEGTNAHVPRQTAVTVVSAVCRYRMRQRHYPRRALPRVKRWRTTPFRSISSPCRRTRRRDARSRSGYSGAASPISQIQPKCSNRPLPNGWAPPPHLRLLRAVPLWTPQRDRWVPILDASSRSTIYGAYNGFCQRPIGNARTETARVMTTIQPAQKLFVAAKKPSSVQQKPIVREQKPIQRNWLPIWRKQFLFTPDWKPTACERKPNPSAKRSLTQARFPVQAACQVVSARLHPGRRTWHLFGRSIFLRAELGFYLSMQIVLQRSPSLPIGST